ncbi:HAD-superfamily hydrolase, subfamily IA, variant 3 [Candidatus Sulfopaludibacter sp. SbA4]|nr:HAD-superfamily hydrolase, subfamily IA, variant 3 [Candidatus Sulfopaludibacter sp. SbA4]
MIDPGLAFIFDMDGVIVDSNPVHREAWAAYNRRFGLETTEAMQERMYGRRNDDIVRDFYGDGLSPEEVAARGADKEELYRQMLGDRIDEILVPGVRQFLERYRQVSMGLASNAERENIDFLLDRAGLRGYFRAVVDGHQVRHPKPDPEIYLRTAKILNIAPVNCIVFEDSYSGVQAARAAGMRVVGVSTTYEDLPVSTITIDNFLGGDLSIWLSQERAI